VHYGGAIRSEISRYEGLMSPYHKAEYWALFSLNLLNAVQNGVFTLGTLLLCYLNAYQISVDLQQVPMFVTLLAYLAQLQAPLNYFGSFCTQIRNNLVDAERILEIVSPPSQSIGLFLLCMLTWALSLRNSPLPPTGNAAEK
jgi:ABC-type transport system involved in Fe-S cluster assembly fused permease/ATPase subunit